jgi:hypothetical protein
MFKIGLHNLFGHLKHKLWPKEGLGIKLAVWLPTIKSRESTRFACVYVACDLLLKSFWWGLQLFLRLHLNWRSVREVMGPKIARIPIMGISGLPGQNVIWMWASWRGTKYIIRGKVVASTKYGPWWVLWVRVCSWLILAPKVSNYALTNLLFSFVQIHVND